MPAGSVVSGRQPFRLEFGPRLAGDETKEQLGGAYDEVKNANEGATPMGPSTERSTTAM